MKYEVGDLVAWNYKEGKDDYFIITGISTDEMTYWLRYIDSGKETFEPTSTFFRRSHKQDRISNAKAEQPKAQVQGR